MTNAVQDGLAEERDETNGGRHAQGNSREQQREDAPDEAQGTLIKIKSALGRT